MAEAFATPCDSLPFVHFSFAVAAKSLQFTQSTSAGVARRGKNLGGSLASSAPERATPWRILTLHGLQIVAFRSAKRRSFAERKATNGAKKPVREYFPALLSGRDRHAAFGPSNR